MEIEALAHVVRSAIGWLPSNVTARINAIHGRTTEDAWPWSTRLSCPLLPLDE